MTEGVRSPSRSRCLERIRAEKQPGRRTVVDDRRLLDEVLPAGWAIDRLDIWGPEKTNHGGSVAYRCRLSHDSGARVDSYPTDPRNNPGRDVIIDHRIVFRDPDGRREELVTGSERLYDHEETFAVLLWAAERFSVRYQLFHSPGEQQ